MAKITLKEIKRMINNGLVKDITTCEPIEIEGKRIIAVATGIYGLNGVLIEDASGKLYGITARSCNLFRYC